MHLRAPRLASPNLIGRLPGVAAVEETRRGSQDRRVPLWAHPPRFQAQRESRTPALLAMQALLAQQRILRTRSRSWVFSRYCRGWEQRIQSASPERLGNL